MSLTDLTARLLRAGARVAGGRRADPPGALMLAFCSAGPKALSAEVFRALMDYLLEHDHPFLTLPQLGQALEQRAVPEGAVCVTFDDDLAATAEPVRWLLRRGGKATLFVVADPKQAYNVWDDDDPWVPRRRRMSWDRVRELIEAGATIGSHTESNRSLVGLDEAGLRRELFDSRRVLVEKLQAPVTCLAYPHGRFDTRAVRAASGVGYDVGCTLQRAYVEASTHPLMMPRFQPRTLAALVDRATGASHLYYRAGGAGQRGGGRVMLWRRR